MAIETYQQLVQDLVRDDAGKVSPEQVDLAIAAAVARLSDVAPRTLVRELANVSGQALTPPTEWRAGLSVVMSIEYPVGRVPREFIASERMELADQPDGSQQILLFDALPAASTVRLTFTAPHQVDSQADTVTEPQQWGVAALAASIVCGQLAAVYANQGDSTISADSVEQKSRSELFAAREREYFRQAYVSWGLPVPGSKAAAAGGGEGKAAATTVRFESRRGNQVQRGLRWI